MNFSARPISSFFMLMLFSVTIMWMPLAHAQSASKVPTVIEQFYVEPENQFSPGTELTFTVEGTPRGTANVRIIGVKRNIRLKEVEPGVYEGSYTITSRDKLTANSTMRATLRARGKTTTESQPLGTGTGSASPAPVTPTPATPTAPSNLVVSSFTAAPISKIEPGADLSFSLVGTPGATATFMIEGVTKEIPMREVKPGHYEGNYTIRRADKFPPNANITGTLAAKGQVNRVRLTQPLTQESNTTFVTNVSPRDRETVTVNPVLISGTFNETGEAAIDPRAVRITVAGNDVTRDALITPQFFTYRADLRPGSYPVEVTARSRAGETVRHSWTFTVGGPAASAATTLPLQIISHTHNAQVPSGPIEVRGITAPNATVEAVVQATASLAGAFGLSQQIFNQSMRADQNGNFSFTFQSPLPVPGAQFQITIVATKGNLRKDEKLVLIQQR